MAAVKRQLLYQVTLALGLLGNLSGAWCPLSGPLSTLQELGAITSTAHGVAIGNPSSGVPLLELGVEVEVDEQAVPVLAGTVEVTVHSSAARLEPLRSVLEQAFTAAAPAEMREQGIRVQLMGFAAREGPVVRYMAAARGDVKVYVRSDLVAGLSEAVMHAAAAGLSSSAPRALAGTPALGESLSSLRNGTIPEVLKCVLGCVVPSTFGTLLAENVAAEGLGCVICKVAKLKDSTCTSLLEAMFLAPIILEPLSALLVFKVCKPICPWGKPPAVQSLLWDVATAEEPSASTLHV